MTIGTSRVGSDAPSVDGGEIVLQIQGMTCASCVRRVEKASMKVAGVAEASVNLATERARLRLDHTIPSEVILEAVRRAGYTATVVDDRLPGALAVGDPSSPDSPLPPGEGQGVRASGGPSRFGEAAVARPTSSAPVAPVRGTAAMEGGPADHGAILDQAIFSLVVSAIIMGLMFWPGIRWNWPDLPISMMSLQWVMLALATPVQFWAGAGFYRSAWAALRHGSTNMHVLVAAGTTAAYAWGAAVTIFPSWFSVAARGGLVAETYFDTSTVIIGLILLGRHLEDRAKRQTGVAIGALLSLQPPEAIRLEDGGERRVAVAEVRVGDLLRVRPGARVPVDGVIEEGTSSIDESMITGESMPARREVDDPVIGATLNGTGTFVMRATRVGRDTTLAQIVRLVDDAQASKAPMQRLADRVAEVFVPAVIVTAIASFALWWFLGPEPRVTFALSTLIAVLIIACPCAMGLATPTAIIVATGEAAAGGVLIRGGEALERAGRVNTIVLDKTGTLTTGHPTVTDVWFADDAGARRADRLRLLGAAERPSEHPLAAAILKAIASEGIEPPSPESFEAVAGRGVVATTDGRHVVAGTAHHLADHGVATASLEAEADRIARLGRTPVLFAIDGQPVGVVGIADVLKPTSVKAVAAFRALGLDAWMLTGDTAVTATAIAAEAGIPAHRVVAGVMPGEKSATIARLQAQGGIVAMVGDGINDAPALAQADLGVAIGTGTDVAIAASDVTLVGGDLMGVVEAVRLSRRTVRVIQQNLFWAFAYNVLLIPVAMGALYPFTQTLLNPGLAAGAMAMSSVSVITNSLRLRTARAATGPGARAAAIRRRAWAAMVATALLVVGGIGGTWWYDRNFGPLPPPGPTIQANLSASDLAFNFRTVEAVVGTPLVITFRNNGVIDHDLNIPGVAYRDLVSVDALTTTTHTMTGTVPVHVAVRRGQQGILSFTPASAGVYRIYCSEPGHKDAGMTATLIVRMPGANT
jgi:Cu+-exporting ATPase